MGKFIIKLDYHEAQLDHQDQKSLLEMNLGINKVLSDLVNSYKDMITVHYNNKSWDKFKKISNEYEFIYTSPTSDCNVSAYHPISRSFFKLWEMLHDFNNVIFQTKRKEELKCLFLAEGPGGFVEAFQKFRVDYHNQSNDFLVGMTLKSDVNKSVPDWKYKSRLKLFYGQDNTGNLYNILNLKSLQLEFGANTFDIITADGGFDFSSDFNNQEVMCYKLLLAETLAALYTQKEGGTFILKIFDIFNENTLRLIVLLQMVYHHVYIVKPLTSRPANSEKYLICTGFSKARADMYYHLLERCLDNETDINTVIGENIPIYNDLVQDVIYYNTHFVLRQVNSIQRTLKLIKETDKSKENQDIILANKKKCQEWCKKYHI